MEPLYIFIDLEAAHGDIFFGDIVEIAAQVDPKRLRNEVFQSLINTNQNLAYFTLEVCKITRKQLNGKKYFPDVFSQFMSWIKKVVKRCCTRYKKVFYPVLIAHGGFDNDFMMIQSNLERNEMDVKILNENNLHFADTYVLAKKLRADGIKCIQGCQLSIENLFKKLFPEEHFIGQHRALPDVQFMIKIFQESPLNKYFHQIPIVTYESRKIDYANRNTSKMESKLLNDNFPKGLAKVTHTMTLKRLLRNGLTLKRLQELFEGSVSQLEFYDALKDVGIERKASKAMASRLGSMGYVCKGNNANIIKDATLTTIVRSDSGYESIVSINENEVYSANDKLDLFYDMFVDEFFYPPVVYKYTFGSFTIKEIQTMDDEIDDLFEHPYGEVQNQSELYGEVHNEAEHKEQYNEECMKIDNNQISSGKCHVKSSSIKNKKSHPLKKNDQSYTSIKVNYKTNQKPAYLSNFVEENWDDDIPAKVTTFHLPTDKGLLAKVIPIGMTEDNLNGKSLSARVPLFNYFDNNEYKKIRPVGGIPPPTGKAKRNLKRDNYLRKRKSKAENKSSVLRDCTDDRTFVKDKSGEVFRLL